MKTTAILLILVQVLSSCITYKNLTKREAITYDFLTHMKTDKKYVFELKIGIKQFVKVTSVKDNIVTGLIFEEGSKGKKTWNPYSATFDSMQNNVAKISILKFNPYLTGAIVVGVLVATGLIIRDNLVIF
jgi:hypothetical protein